MTYQKVGKVVHYFDKILVAVIEATDGKINVGDMVRIGKREQVWNKKWSQCRLSMLKWTEWLRKEAALKVTAAVKTGDIVYKASE